MSSVEAQSTSKWIAIVTAAIAASAPLTAAVYTWLSKEKELEISERQQDYTMRMGFLDRAIDPARPPKDRQIVLRFLSKITTDKVLSDWATSELSSVDAELDTATARVKELEATSANLGAETKRLNAELAKLQATSAPNDDKKQLTELKEKVRVTESKLQDTVSELGSARAVVKPSGAVPSVALDVKALQSLLSFDPMTACSSAASLSERCKKRVPLGNVKRRPDMAFMTWDAPGDGEKETCLCVAFK